MYVSEGKREESVQECEGVRQEKDKEGKKKLEGNVSNHEFLHWTAIP